MDKRTFLTQFQNSKPNKFAVRPSSLRHLPIFNVSLAFHIESEHRHPWTWCASPTQNVFAFGEASKAQEQQKVGGAGFEPAKAEPTDLQSVPFDRFGTPPCLLSSSAFDFYKSVSQTSQSLRVQGAVPKEISTNRLIVHSPNPLRRTSNSRASGGVRTHDLWFTKPLLCQLSYAG